jgi:hypothetical protein
MAILTKAQLEALNQSSFPDQSTEAITPAILRNYNTQTIDTLVDSLDTGSFIQDLTSLNAFTASQLSINSGLNASTASQQISINALNAATSSYITESETGSFVTAINNNPLTPLTFTYDQPGISTNVTLDLPASIVSSSAQITALGFVSSSVTASSLITASFSGNTLTFTKGNGTTFGVVIPDVSGSTLPSGLLSSSVTNFTDYSASVDSRINAITGSGGTIPAGTVSSSAQIINYGIFATTGSNTFRGNQILQSGYIQLPNGFNMQGNVGDITNLSAPNTIQFITEPPAGPGGTNDIKFINRVSGSSIIFENTQAGSGNRIDLTGGEIRLQAQVASGSNGRITIGSNTTQIDAQFTPILAAAITSSGLLVNGNLTASLQQGYVWVGDASGKTTTVATSSFGGGGSTPAGTISGSSQITALGFVSSSVTASSLITASASGANITFTKGDNTQFTVTVATGSVTNAETASIAGNLVITARNGGASTLAAGTVVHITGASGDNPIFTTASYDNEALSSNTFGLLRYSSPSGADVEVVVGGIVTSVNTDPALGYAAGDILYLSSSGQFTNIQPQAPNQIVTLGQVLRAQQNNGSVYVSINNGWELNELHNVQITSPQTNELLAYESSSYGLWKNKSISTLGLATTGSNTFVGDETFADASGNASTISPWSGSFVLVSKGVTSGSAGLSNISSITGSVNLIFKANNPLTGSLTISGSSNIINAATSPTAGFRRQIGSNNIILTGVTPEISSSIAFAVGFSNNYANNVMRFRGPVSSSAWSFTNNIVNANLNIGNADATSANQAIAGGNISSNVLLAAVNYNAYTTPLVAQAVYQANLSVGNATLTAFSSSIAANNNIFVGNTFTVNNRYFGTSSTNAAQRLSLQNNVFGGFGTPTLTAEGSNTSTSAPREAIGNTTNGGGLAIGLVLSGDNSHLYSTLIHGSNLTVTGSNAYNTQASAGSTFIGRNNDRNGTRANSGETIFAVGTGTGTATRKTGFLIDSGSNTFIEGTLNVSGSTSFNGAVNITGSLTSSLTEGYVWVGGAGNVSTLAATSSFGGVTSAITASSLITASVNLNTITFTKGDSTTFAITVDTGSGGGGTVPAGTVSSSAQITNYGIFATTGSNTFTGTQTIQVADLITNGGVYFNGSPFDGGVPIDNKARWVITPGGTQFSQNFTSNSSANTNGVTVLYNNSTSSFESSIQLTAQQSGSQSNVIITNNSGSTNIELSANVIELSGSIQLPSGTNKPAGIVSVNGTATVTNSLVTTDSIILVTTQNGVVSGTEYPAVVTGKTNGSFDIQHNYGGNLSVGYLIINPIL